MSSSSLIEEATKVIPNRFVLSKVLTKRIRQLKSGVKPKIEIKEKTPFMDIALIEIIKKKLEIVGLDK